MMSESTIYTFEDWLEENPYDPSRAQEHFQTEDEYVEADAAYRDKREKEAWEAAIEVSARKIQTLESQLTEKEALLKEAVEVIESYYHCSGAEMLKYMDEKAREFLAKLKAGEE